MTRSRSYTAAVIDLDAIAAAAKQLLLTTDLTDKKVRLLGISISNFHEQVVVHRKKDNGQLSFEF